MNDLSKATRSIKVWGWVVLVMGILCLLAPLASGVTIAIVVGSLMLLAGLGRLIDAFQGGGFWQGLLGLISLVGGVAMFAHPLLGLASLTMVLVVYFLMVGASEVALAFRMRPVGGWGFLLFSGLVSILMAYLIFSQWPLSGAWAVGVLVGVQLIFSGMTMITMSSAFKAELQ